MEENDYNLGEKFEEALSQVKKSIKKPNILIAGATGVGKSSIINMIFGDEVAKVGTGKPVTQKIDVYEDDDVDVRIFDSKGYEVGDEADDEFYNSVVSLAKETNTPNNAIHLIWYCISCSNTRVVDYDIKALESFAKSNIPVAVLLTKVDIATDEEVEKMRSSVPTNLQNALFETTTELSEYNQIEELIKWSIDRLPDSLRFAFIKSQQVCLEEKRKTARMYIKQQCAAAFAVGWVPIPISDAPILVANEVILITRILYLYGMDSISKSIPLSTIVNSLFTSLGKAAVASLIKLIPGVGSALGGFISGVVGSTITAAIGEATSTLAYYIDKAKLNGNYGEAESMIKNFGPLLLKYASEWIKSGKQVNDIPDE